MVIQIKKSSASDILFFFTYVCQLISQMLHYMIMHRCACLAKVGTHNPQVKIKPDCLPWTNQCIHCICEPWHLLLRMSHYLVDSRPGYVCLPLALYICSNICKYVLPRITVPLEWYSKCSLDLHFVMYNTYLAGCQGCRLWGRKG